MAPPAWMYFYSKHETVTHTKLDFYGTTLFTNGATNLSRLTAQKSRSWKQQLSGFVENVVARLEVKRIYG